MFDTLKSKQDDCLMIKYLHELKIMNEWVAHSIK